MFVSDRGLLSSLSCVGGSEVIESKLRDLTHFPCLPTGSPPDSSLCVGLIVSESMWGWLDRSIRRIGSIESSRRRGVS